ncbi:MAG: T9SS type A sorting domain-containing protein [Lewinellaceae bacterium]|nr:T9SS type A sorting domain-containing protein [Saprospiraceae bacterium]MCB9271018.1 T9SS type A sorting domain-containing protein [Lewinellaceae bacterium]HQU54346.1 T9SS type A sorting domain-containing protein [Saprospiraceae bacterium]
MSFKPKRWQWTVFLILLVVLYLGNSQGRAFDANSGNTGAPGETATCQTCHNSSALQVTLSISLTDTFGNVRTTYLPDSTYRVTVEIERKLGVPVAYGFQLVSIIDTSLADAGTWVRPAENVRIASSSRTKHNYAEHKGLSASNIFVTDWVAPPAGTGAVTFYSAGVGANLSGNDSGDGASATHLGIAEEVTSSIHPASVPALTFYPNPVQQFIYASSQINGTYFIFDPAGRTMQQGKWQNPIDLGSLPSGVYWMQLMVDNAPVTVHKILKL